VFYTGQRQADAPERSHDFTRLPCVFPVKISQIRVGRPRIHELDARHSNAAGGQRFNQALDLRTLARIPHVNEKGERHARGGLLPVDLAPCPASLI
jgi:hypothetical protein